MQNKKCVFYINRKKKATPYIECPYVEQYKREIETLNKLVEGKSNYQIINYNSSRRLFVIEDVRLAYIQEVIKIFRDTFMQKLATNGESAKKTAKLSFKEIFDILDEIEKNSKKI